MSPKIFVKKTVIIGSSIASTCPPVTPPTVKWGPSFGQPHSTDGNTFAVGVSGPSMPSLALSGQQGVGTHISMPALAAVYSTRQLAVGTNISMPSLAVVASSRQLAVGTHISENLAATYSTRQLAVGTNVSMPSLAVTASTRDLAIGTNISMPSLKVTASSRQLAVGLRGATAGWLLGTTSVAGAGAWKANKDIWWSTAAVCVSTACNDGTNLQVDGAVAAARHAMVAWDLTNIASTKARVQSATLILHKTNTNVTAPVLNILKISTANETWKESGSSCVRCGHTVTTGGPAGTTQNFTLPTGTGEVAIALNAAWKTKIQNRLGKGFCTFYLAGGALSTAIFVTKNGVANSSLGPRLVLNFNST